MVMSLAPWVGVAAGDVDCAGEVGTARFAVDFSDGERVEHGVVLSQLLDIEPGPAAMAVLGGIDPGGLDAAGRVALVQAWERQHAWLCAQQQTALAAAAGPQPTGDDWVQDEIAAAIRLSGRAAQQRIHVARMLTQCLPKTRALLAAGVLSWRHALAMVDASGRLDRRMTDALETRVLPAAAEQTVAEFNRLIRRTVLALEPAVAEASHAAAKAERAVRLVPEPDGMASLVATMPATDARAVFLALDALARGRQAAEGGRRRDGIGIDGHRVDALIALADAALADGTLPRAHGRRVELQVLIELPTLLGLRDNPAALAGYGPIPASLARELAVDATWRRLVTDPTTGHLLDYGRTTYRAPRALADFVIARDRRCRFVSCGQPAFRCDIDHADPYDNGGRTSCANCCMLCRRHHRLKTRGRWTIRLRPDGSLTWRSAAGLEYHLRPRSQLEQ